MKNTTETQSTELLTVVVGLEPETSKTLLDKFTPLFDKAKEWKEKAEALVVTDISQVKEMKQAREARLALKDIRVEADKTRKALKEDSLRYGKAVQGVYNVIEYLIAPIEQHLQEQEDFAKIQEQKRIDALRDERLSELIPLGYEHKPGVDLGTMDEALFAAVKSGLIAEQKRKADEAKAAEAARIEAKRVQDLHDARKQFLLDRWQFMTDEEKQISFGTITDTDFNTLISTLEVRKEQHDKKQAEIEAEVARLKAASDEQAKAEAAKGEVRRQRLQILKPYNYVHESDVAELTTEEFHTLTEKVASDYRAEQKRLNDEKEAREKKVAEDARIAAELKAKQDAEAKAEADRLAALEAEASKGDAEKFVSFMNDLKALTTKYTFTGKKYITLYATCVELINKILTYGTDKTKKQ